MSKKDHPTYEHIVPKFLQNVLNRNNTATELEEKIRTDRANINIEDLGEEAPQIVEADEEALKEYQEAENAKKLREEKLRQEEEMRIKERENRAQIMEKSKFSITEDTGHVFRSSNSWQSKGKDSKSKEKLTKLSRLMESDESDDESPLNLKPKTNTNAANKKKKQVRPMSSVPVDSESDEDLVATSKNEKSQEVAGKADDDQSLFKKRKRFTVGGNVEKSSKQKTGDA